MRIGNSVTEKLALLILAYGEDAMKKFESIERYKRFKEKQDDSRSVKPKIQRTDANVNRARTLVHSDQISCETKSRRIE